MRQQLTAITLKASTNYVMYRVAGHTNKTRTTDECFFSFSSPYRVSICESVTAKLCAIKES